MKRFSLLLVVLFFFNINFLISKDYIFIDFYPDIEPVKSFVKDFVNYMNFTSKSYEYLSVNDRKIFKNSYEILDGVQSNLIQFAIIPAFVVNNRFNKVLTELYSFKNTNVMSFMIPLREKLMNYGLFLLDLFFAGKYSIFSKLRIDKRENLKKSIFGYIINSDNLKNFFSKNFKTLLYVDSINDIQGLIKSDIINTVFLTPVQFYRLNLLNYPFIYQKKMNNVSEYYVIIANNSFWNEIRFDEKSIIWSYISKYKDKFKINFSKYYIYVENEILKKISQYRTR